jgi:hypothetical protein
MRRLDGGSQRKLANIGRKFGEVRLIELVAAIVQNPDTGVRDFTPVVLQMLERDLGVIPTVVQTDRRQVTEARPKVGR